VSLCLCVFVGDYIFVCLLPASTQREPTDSPLHISTSALARLQDSTALYHRTCASPASSAYLHSLEMLEITLSSLGWTPALDEVFKKDHAGRGLMPARVSRNSKQIYHILCEDGEFVARVSGNFRHHARIPSDYPAVGDWVVIKTRPDDGEAEILALLPRRTVFSRQAVSAAGADSQSREQVLATNVDVALLVAALDGARGFNLRRLERYLTLARNSGAKPVLILNKIDLCDDPAPAIAATEAIAAGAPVHALSALDESAIGPLRELIGEGTTIVLLGPSGIGKSTIINAIAGEEIMSTGEVRESDHRGRHTTTWSELNIIERGGILIDTPGLRDVQLWTDQAAIDQTFAEIQKLALECRFRDCQHQKEPGCAVRQALDDDKLDAKRLQSYFKQTAEAAEAELRRQRDVKKKHAKSRRTGRRGGTKKS
jgi:ribosome biogenesis GTPase